MKIIILAGGSGTRLWPLSRDRYPKQFIKFKIGGQSLFQLTFETSLLLAGLDDIFVVTNEKCKFLVMGSIEELGYDYCESNIIVEPESKNTLPAIYAGVHEIAKNGSDTVVVFPSDHLIIKYQKFVEVIKNTEALAKDSIITFGIEPDGPNTEYGYIAPGNHMEKGYKVKEFKEKPELEDAQRYVADGYYWNAGIFMFNTDVFFSEVKLYALDVYNAFETSKNIKETFNKIDGKISIDYGIMEKSKNVVVVPVDIGWNDLGSFDSLFNVFSKDENNNVVESENIVINSRNNYIYSEKGKLVSTIGIDDLIVIDSKDALLICKKDQSQKVKEVVATLKSRNDSRTEYNMQGYRPWGNYRILEEEKSLVIKKITINQGKKINCQLHRLRSEHWIVVKGIAKVTIDDTEKIVPVGESIFIKSGQKHKLENHGMEPLEIIEIQMGEDIKEADIIRFDDGLQPE